jgi:hypothetical protein
MIAVARTLACDAILQMFAMACICAVDRCLIIGEIEPGGGIRAAHTTVHSYIGYTIYVRTTVDIDKSMLASVI